MKDPIFRLARFILILTSMSILGGRTIAQTFEKLEIGESGCSATFPSKPSWNLQTDEDNNRVWSGAVRYEGTRFGIYCVEFAEPKLKDSRSKLKSYLENYLDGLQESFDILEHAGYHSTSMDSDPKVVGISDSWSTLEMKFLRIQAWIDPYHLAFLYIIGESGMPDMENGLMYLDSFEFPKGH